jgi:hypothetical protein
MAAVQQCLEDAGLQVRAARPGPDDDDAIENCVEA